MTRPFQPSGKEAIVPDGTALDIERYGRLDVYYTHELDGGGRTFGQQFIPFLRDRIGPVRTAFEWCAGPGFIGFSMLSEGLCEHLALADVNPAAVEIAAKTVEENALRSTVESSARIASMPSLRTGSQVSSPTLLTPERSGRVHPHIDRPGVSIINMIGPSTAGSTLRVRSAPPAGRLR